MKKSRKNLEKISPFKRGPIVSFLGSFWDLDFDCEFWGRLFDCDFRLCIERPILSGGSAMDSPTRTFSFHPRRPLLLRSKGCPRSIDSLAYFSPMEFDPSIQGTEKVSSEESRQPRCASCDATDQCAPAQARGGADAQALIASQWALVPRRASQK